MKRICTDKAVYWGSPVSDGTGGYTYASPVEIDCRWENKTNLVRGSQGEEATSSAMVFTLIDLDVNGYLYHGTLDELDSAPLPKESASKKIINFSKIPNARNTGYLRKAYLQ